MVLQRFHIITLLILSFAWAHAQDRLSVTTHDGVGGRVSVQTIGERTYTFTAEPAIGYEFRGWTDGATDISRTYVHPTSGGYVRFDAIFGKSEYVSQRDGHVDIQVADTTIPSFVLSAVPNTDASFKKWSNGDGNTQISYIENDGNLIPFFNYSKGRLNATTHEGAGGKCEISQTGERTFCFTAIANSGYSFWGWSDGVPASTNPRCYTLPAEEVDYQSFYAVFTKNADINQPNGITQVAVDDSSLPSFNLTAQPNADAVFYKWNNGLAVQSIAYQESEGTRIPIYGLPDNHLRVTVINGTGGILNLNPITTRNYSILATANNGYSFWGWTDGEGNNLRTYNHPIEATEAKIFHAAFTRDSDMWQPGGITQVGVQNPDAPIYSLTAQADLECGTSFYCWNSGATTPTVSYKETEGTRLPRFTHGDNAVGYTLIDATGGRIDVTKDSCGFALNPIPNKDYIFVHWEDNSTEYPRYVDYVAATYHATFTMANYKVEEEYFATLEEAITYAGENKAIELIHDMDSVVVPANILLEGKGNSISCLIISNGAKVTLNSELIVDQLVLNTTSGISAQLQGENYLRCQKIYLDILLDPLHPQATAEQWYAFAVPFPVDVQTGIARQEGSPTHVLGRDYLVYEYDGNLRAATGTGWKLKTSGMLMPGNFYMIAISDSQNIWRMQMASGASWTTNTSLPLYQYFTTSCKHRGWNAVANPLLYYVDAEVESGIQIAQVYVNGANPARYDVKNLFESSFVLASPFFIQTADDDNLLFTSATHSALYAPNRHRRVAEYFRVNLLDNDSIERDVLYITASEMALNQYEFGKDVLKLGNNANYPRLSAQAYGYNLCAQYVPIMEREAIVDLQLFIPETGIYAIDINRWQLDTKSTVYLVCNGQRVWNLSTSKYTTQLDAGLHEEYELDIVFAHQISTGVEESSHSGSVEKYIKDSHLYIHVNGHTYDVLGANN